MAGVYKYNVELESNVSRLLQDTKQLQDRMNALEDKEYKIDLGIDSKQLESVISNLSKMLDSLGKGTSDFKQFEILSKDISDMVGSVKSLSSALGKIDDSGAGVLLSTIQNIDKSLNSLNQTILQVSKNFGNIGEETKGKVGDSAEKIKSEAKKAAEGVKQIDFTPNTEGFDEVIAKFKYLADKKDEIEKITKVSKQTKDGGYDVSYNAKFKNGTTYNLGENSTPQVLNANETVYNAKSKQSQNAAVKKNNEEYKKQLAIIQQLTDARTALNNAERLDKNGNRSIEIADIKKQISDLQPKANAAAQAIEEMYNPQNGGQATITAEQYNAALEKINESAKGSAKSVNDLIAAQKRNLESINKDYESDVSTWKEKLANRETKPAEGKRSSTYEANLEAMRTAVGEMVTLQQRMKATMEQGIAPDEDDVNKFDELKKKVQGCEQAFKNMSTAEKGASEMSRDKLFNKIDDYLQKNSGMAKEFKVQLQALQKELSMRGADANVADLTDQFLKLQIQIREAGQEGRSFFDVLKDKAWYGVIGQIATYFSFNDIIRYGGEAARAVVELDTALIDLKKTTTMTGSQLNQFYFDANDVAKQMGVTTKEIIEQASQWSRLGYNSKEAATEMAKLSSKFAAISPGMSTENAADGLVSIMKAFDVSVDDVESRIINKINVLGNKFAENNEDVVEGLKRSSAAMAAMGQSFEDTAALFTGGMEILRDSESMGTALRSIAMRVRGYSEETGELDGELKNVAGDVLDLTKTAKNAEGVSIFTDASQEHYKSMVQYLGEIADRWDDISEVNQTEILSKLFAKTRAQAGAAILKNFSQVRKALVEMEDSANSADNEMSAIESSLEYKLNALRQTWVGVAQSIGNREGIGTAIEGLTKLSEVLGTLLDKFGLFPTALTAIGAVLSTQNVGRDKMYSLAV